MILHSSNQLNQLQFCAKRSPQLTSYRFFFGDCVLSRLVESCLQSVPQSARDLAVDVVCMKCGSLQSVSKIRAKRWKEVYLWPAGVVDVPGAMSAFGAFGAVLSGVFVLPDASSRRVTRSSSKSVAVVSTPPRDGGGVIIPYCGPGNPVASPSPIAISGLVVA